MDIREIVAELQELESRLVLLSSTVSGLNPDRHGKFISVGFKELYAFESILDDVVLRFSKAVNELRVTE